MNLHLKLDLRLALTTWLCAQGNFLRAALAPTVLEDFNRPFLFSYLAWQDKAHMSNGVAVLRGFNNQGGAGLNGEWNLADQAALIPALKLRVVPSNQAAALVLMLKDAGQGEGRWEFPLPAATADFTTVLPRDGASLAEPNAISKDGKPDLAKLRQLQLIGDWAGGKAVDVEVDAVLLMPAAEEVLGARAARTKRLADEAEKQHKERLALQTKYGKRSDDSPSVEHVSAVAPDVLAIEIQAGRLVPAKLVKYEAQPGDQRREARNKEGVVETIVLERGGKPVGYLIGTNREWLTIYEDVSARSPTCRLR